MNRLYEFTSDDDIRTIDLLTIHQIRRSPKCINWTVYPVAPKANFDVTPDVGAALLAAWLCYVNSEYAPDPAEPAHVAGELPPLPKGWAWGSTAADDHTTAVFHNFGAVTVRGAPGAEIINITGHVRLDVVEIVIAAHRFRAAEGTL